MMPEKIILKKYLKIRKGKKNVKNPHIRRTFPILHNNELLKNFGDIICLGYYLNRFIALWRWSNGLRKKSKSKNTKNLTRVRRV